MSDSSSHRHAASLILQGLYENPTFIHADAQEPGMGARLVTDSACLKLSSPWAMVTPSQMCLLCRCESGHSLRSQCDWDVLSGVRRSLS